MRRCVLWAAAIGIIMPILIFSVSEALLITATWWFSAIPFVWPTYILMLPFSGPVDGMTLVMLLISAAANAVIYGIIGAILYWIVGKTRHPGHARTTGSD